MATINFRYSDEDKDVLRAEAEKFGFSSLSNYMVHITKNRANSSSALQRNESSNLKRNGKLSNNIVVRVTKGEKAAFKNYCSSTGETESAVLLRQIRILLNNGADFSKEELAELRKATNQVTAIGRNLNQIVTQINSGVITDSKLSAYNIEQLKQYIDNQAKAIKRLIQKTKDRVIENE